VSVRVADTSNATMSDSQGGVSVPDAHAQDSFFIRSDEPLDDEEEMWAVELDREGQEIVVLGDAAIRNMTNADLNTWMEHWREKGFKWVAVEDKMNNRRFYQLKRSATNPVGSDDPETQMFNRHVLR
jgi:hypothetical protein